MQKFLMLELHVWQNLGRGNIFADSLSQANPGDTFGIGQTASLVLFFHFTVTVGLLLFLWLF